MADSRKNILIVFGHHDRQSLNGAMLDIAVEALTNEGHHVVVSDLHAMKFNPVLGRHDVIGKCSDSGSRCHTTKSETCAVRDISL